MDPKTKIKLARKLRRDQTEAEKLLWRNLRNRQLGGYKFRRQVPVDNYVADFICEAAKLIVELDGGQHDDDRTKDALRTQTLERCGYKVLRFWNNQVSENLDGVLITILSEIKLDNP